MSYLTSTRTLIIFWAIAIPALVVWFFVAQWMHHPAKFVSVAHRTAEVFPGNIENDTLLALAHHFLQSDNRERSYLFLLQNNLELRPGGGYIGSFAIVKIKNGYVTHQAVHNTNVFDGRVPHDIAPPYPLAQTLNIPSWQMRDSNYTYDFPTNATWAQDFYHAGGGEERFDGIIALNAHIFDALLTVTGPITLAHYPGTYKAGDAVRQLEYQVEAGYREQGIDKGDRKAIINALGTEIVERITKLSLRDKIGLIEEFRGSFDNKDVQVFLKDKTLQQRVDAQNWSGRVDQKWHKDYIAVVDANLAALKSDYYIKRSISYKADLSQSVPQGTIALTYDHTAQRKDWMTTDYQSFVRIYIPDDSWVIGVDNAASEPVYGEEFGKKYVGFLVHVPIRQSKTVTLTYHLPRVLKNLDNYDLKVQKQSGVYNVPVHVSLTGVNGMSGEYDFTLNGDVVLSDLTNTAKNDIDDAPVKKREKSSVTTRR